MSNFNDKYSETFNTWNNLADIYDEKFNAIRIYDHTYEHLLELLPAGSKVLDLGCGPAIVSGYLKLKRPDLQIYGADVAPNMIELAQRNVPDGIFSVQDCRKPEYPENSFDAVVAAFLIPYFNTEELDELLSRTHKMSKAKSALYVSFVAGSPEKSDYKTGTAGMRVYFYYHELETVKKQLSNNGYQLEAEYQVPYPNPDSEEKHTILIATKK